MTVSVRNILSKRGINVDPSCLMCFIASEFVLDLLRDCSVDNSFWSTILDVPANVSIHSPFLYLIGLNLIVPLLFLILKAKFLGKFCFSLTFGIYGLIVIELCFGSHSPPPNLVSTSLSMATDFFALSGSSIVLKRNSKSISFN